MFKNTHFYFFAAASFVSVNAISSTPDNRIKPNILLINIDDLGWSDLSFAGSKYYETPNVDLLKSTGIYFSNGYACAANCAPSRASLMSGEYPPRHGIYTVSPPDRGESKYRKLVPYPNIEVLDDKIYTLAEALRDGGYATCHVGKWHLGEDPTTQGMDINIGGNMQGHPKTYFSPYGNPNLKDGESGEYLNDRLANEAIKYIENANRSKPFFLYYATYVVHTPLQTKPELEQKYKAKQGTNEHSNPKYAGMVETMDTNVGRLLATLKSTGLIDNTIIIFVGDNGGLYSVSKQHPLRAGKGSFYEGGIRVPFIVSWKGKIKPGVTSNQPVSQIDLFPTLLDVAGIKKPSDKILDGVSILPTLLGKKQKLEKRALYWHFPAYLEGGNSETTDSIFRSRPVSVIRQGDWKLIENIETGKLELYNLKTDVSETKELSTQNPDIAQKLFKKLKSWQVETNAPIPTQLNPEFGKESSAKKGKGSAKKSKNDDE